MAEGQFEYFQLRCFVAVAEELSFRRAAERLNMTQSPLSRQIKLLEEQVNLRLFDRNNRRVELTAAGDSFYRSALDLLRRSEHAVLTARQAEQADFGSIALGFVPSAALRFVPLIAEKMSVQMPRVTLKPVEMMGYEVIEAQRSGRIDLGLTRMERPRRELDRTLVVHECFVIALHRNNPLAAKPDLSVTDLDGEPYISFTTDRGGFLKETVFALFSSHGVVPDTRLEFSQTHAIISMVNQGIGFAIVPKSASVMQMENIVFRDIDLPKEFRSDMYLVSGSGQKSELREQTKRLIIETLKPYCEG